MAWSRKVGVEGRIDGTLMRISHDIYIYIFREGEKERERHSSRVLGMFLIVP